MFQSRLKLTSPEDSNVPFKLKFKCTYDFFFLMFRKCHFGLDLTVTVTLECRQVKVQREEVQDFR